MREIILDAKLRFLHYNHDLYFRLVLFCSGSSQLELGVFALEVIRQLTTRGLRVERTYVGSLMTSLDTSGFQFSALKLPSNSNLKRYLDAPTAAPAWPKILDISALGPNWVGKYFTTEIHGIFQS